jgi:hypothetical protein
MDHIILFSWHLSFIIWAALSQDIPEERLLFQLKHLLLLILHVRSAPLQYLFERSQV